MLDPAAAAHRDLLRRTRWWLVVTAALLLALSAAVARIGRVRDDVKTPVIGERIDLNAAPVGELALLPGVGPAKAAAIVAHRNEHGPFRSVSDLEAVPGIGPKILRGVTPFVAARPVRLPPLPPGEGRGEGELQRDDPG